VLEELDALARIAEIDTQAHAAESELNGIPEQLGTLDADVDTLRGLLDAEREELAEADALLSAQDAEIQNANSSLAKSKSKAARARNMREADAVERELEVVRRTLRDRETERETLSAAIETRRQSVTKHEGEFQKLHDFAAEEHRKSDARLGELRGELDTVLAGRAAEAAKVPGDVMRRYELIRKRRGGVAVAHVKADSCSGCQIGIRPMQVIAIQKCETLEQCPQCSRFLLRTPEASVATADESVDAEPAAPDATESDDASSDVAD